MRLFGLIGYPLGHSFSKKYFSQKFLDEGITDCRYELFPLANIGELPGLLSAHPDLCGLNVTIPYKEQVIAYLDHPGVASAIGACNCIDIRQGQRYGYNTDVIGFRESFAPALRAWDKAALVLGTGGAAKAVAYVLGQLGIGFRYVSRKPYGVGDPVGGTGGTATEVLGYADITPTLLETYTVIINCSPVGTFPNIGDAPSLPYDALSARHYLYDLVYNPEKTRFLKEGQARGAVIRNGYEMLRLQAEEAWRIWNGEAR
jgi:shikimate dehydrogenase